MSSSSGRRGSSRRRGSSGSSRSRSGVEVVEAESSDRRGSSRSSCSHHRDRWRSCRVPIFGVDDDLGGNTSSRVLLGVERAVPNSGIHGAHEGGHTSGHGGGGEVDVRGMVLVGADHGDEVRLGEDLSLVGEIIGPSVARCLSM